MNRTKIEYADWTWNSITGCYGPGGTKEQPRHCSYCYAKRIAERFKGTRAFPDGFEPTLHPDRLDEPLKAKAGSRIFVGSMSDIGADWVTTEYFRQIMSVVWLREDVTFIFLTKQPQNLARHNPWPDNAWVGVTATDQIMHSKALTGLDNVKARVKFISYEPILSKVMLDYPWEPWGLNGIDWAILGAQTQPLKLPKRLWVDEIELAADEAGAKVFEKNNLASLFPDRSLRQELPT